MICCLPIVSLRALAGFVFNTSFTGCWPLRVGTPLSILWAISASIFRIPISYHFNELHEMRIFGTVWTVGCCGSVAQNFCFHLGIPVCSDLRTRLRNWVQWSTRSCGTTVLTCRTLRIPWALLLASISSLSLWSREEFDDYVTPSDHLRLKIAQGLLHWWMRSL